MIFVCKCHLVYELQLTWYEVAVILQKLSYMILFGIAQVISLFLAVMEGTEILAEKNSFWKQFTGCAGYWCWQVINVGRT